MSKVLTITPNLEATMRKRYYREGENTPQDMIRRVVKWVANGEKLYGMSDEEIQKLEDRYFDKIDRRLWIPSSPFLMNGGTERPMVFACFVVGGLNDNLPDIYKALSRQGMINALGGGTGFTFKRLREDGSSIGSTGGTSSGIMSFADLFNQNGEIIKQGGRRRSANMIVLPYNHPEIMKFVDYKLDPTKLTNFNMSVLVDDNFMKKVQNNEEFDLISPKNNKKVGKMSAKELYDKIMLNSWKSGEPALLFKDAINKNNPVRIVLGDIEATNPCGEQPLYEDESCNLVSINLEEFVGWDGEVDWKLLRETVEDCVRFSDTAIDINYYPDEIIKDKVMSLRRLGIGIMSLHGALIKAGLKYSSVEGRNFAQSLMSYINSVAFNCSYVLAREKGTFPLWESSYYAKREFPVKVRNIARTTIAPTGTIQQILNTSSGGGEPIFAIVYMRLIDGVETYWVNPLFEEVAKREVFWTDDLPKKINDNMGRVKGVNQVPKKWQELFETAMEISAEDHVHMQGALQVHVDNAISKTINMPKDATVEDVANAYMLGWSLGLKGMTIYRDGSRDSQVLNVGNKEESKVEVFEDTIDTPIGYQLPRGYIKEAPQESNDSRTVRLYSGCGTMYLTMTKDEEGDIDQTFVARGSTGTCMANQMAVSRLMSLALRGGISVEDVIDQLKSIPVCPSYYGKKCSGGNVSKGSSCPSAIAFELERYSKDKVGEKIFIEDGNGKKIPIYVNPKDKEPSYYLEKKTNLCPECGDELTHEGGCINCVSCGWSKCE